MSVLLFHPRHRRSFGISGEKAGKVILDLKPVGAGGGGDRIDHCARSGAADGRGKKPVASAYAEGAYGVLHTVV